MNEQTKSESVCENDMSTPVHRALHYVQCYALRFPTSGADEVTLELLSLLTKELEVTVNELQKIGE